MHVSGVKGSRLKKIYGVLDALKEIEDFIFLYAGLPGYKRLFRRLK